jgi:hypothetical protein
LALQKTQNKESPIKTQSGLIITKAEDSQESVDKEEVEKENDAAERDEVVRAEGTEFVSREELKFRSTAASKIQRTFRLWEQRMNTMGASHSALTSLFDTEIDGTGMCVICDKQIEDKNVHITEVTNTPKIAQ